MIDINGKHTQLNHDQVILMGVYDGNHRDIWFDDVRFHICQSDITINVKDVTIGNIPFQDAQISILEHVLYIGKCVGIRKKEHTMSTQYQQLCSDTVNNYHNLYYPPPFTLHCYDGNVIFYPSKIAILASLTHSPFTVRSMNTNHQLTINCNVQMCRRLYDSNLPQLDNLLASLNDIDTIVEVYDYLGIQFFAEYFTV